MRMPPSEVIDLAIRAANTSPCAKSKRGVALFFIDDGGVVRFSSVGVNTPPGGLPCLRTEACAKRCASYCVHAEQRALCAVRYGDPLSRLEAVHVKTVDGALVPGGGPSCLPCANAVMDAEIAAFWLYEVDDPPRWRRYTTREFYDATAAHVGLWRSEL